MGKKLNPRQKAFANWYLKTLNATEAAKRAGYSERSAASIGSENLRKPEIAAYIHERVRAQDLEFVASADEALVFLSAVMRGQIKDAFGLDAALADRLKAADALMKRHELAEERSAENKREITVRFLGDESGEAAE